MNILTAGVEIFESFSNDAAVLSLFGSYAKNNVEGGDTVLKK